MKIFAVIALTLFSSCLFAQQDELPVTLLASSDTSKPMIFYLSGDGGWNKFSSALAETINKNGYAIASLNSKSYFWEKKSPERAALDISNYLQKQLAVRKNQQVVLAGYSLGADVIPFLVNKFPPTLKAKLLSLVLLSPSTSTDLEVHWTDILGLDTKRSMDVIMEINKMGSQKTIVIIGSNENDFPIKEIKLKNYINETLPGGHHFEGNTEEVAGTMMRYFK